MQYAGPLNTGDMAVRRNEVAPGVAALLQKQSRNPGSGIYELPTAKPENPDFYNMSLDNVQAQLRNAAKTINTLAPEGESLAYINPEEAGILKLLGGAGEPDPVTGIPSFYTPGSSSLGGYGGYSSARYKEDKSGGARDVVRNETARQEAADRVSKTKEMFANNRGGGNNKPDPVGPSETYGGSQVSDENQFDYVPMVVGGIGAQEFDKEAKEIKGPKYGSEDTTIPGFTKDIADNFAMQALINAYVGNAAPLMQTDSDGIYRFQKAGTSQAGLDALQGLDALRGQANNTIFSSDFSKMFNEALKDEGMVKKGIFGDYQTDDGKMLAQALGGGSSGIGNLMSNVGLTGLLSNLFNTDDLTLEERLRRQKMIKDAMDRQNQRGGESGQGQATQTEQTTTEEDEDESEEEVDFFSKLQRRFNMPITLESLKKRFMTGDPNRKNLLEDLSDAVDRAKEEAEAENA